MAAIIAVFFYYLVLPFLLYKLAKGIWTTWLGSALGFGYKLRAKPDSYAVITGATDGIGLEYAKYFAKRGFNLLIIGRSEEKLQAAQAQIQEAAATRKREIQVQTHQADFSQTDIYDAIEQKVQQLPRIDVLVNNAGISYEYAEYLGLLKNARATIDNLVNVNMTACTQMVNIVLPLMAKNRSGLVLNLSSFSASYPSPLLAVYGASKTYVDFLSRALQVEYAGKGIVIQSILPAFVATKMSKIRRASLMVPSPATYVAAQMRTVGLESRTYGYWPHKLQGFVMDNIISILPFSDLNAYIVFKNLKNVRRRVYKKHNLKEE